MRYAITVDVAVPRDELVALVDDPTALADWPEDLVAVEHLDGEPGRPGSRTRLRYLRGGQPVDVVQTVVEDDGPRGRTCVDATPGGTREVRHEFEALGAYATRWTQHVSCALDGPGLAALGVVMPGALVRGTRRRMRALKLTAERLGRTVPEPLPRRLVLPETLA